MAQRDILHFLKVKRMESNEYVSTSEIVFGIQHIRTDGTRSRNILRQQLNKLVSSKVLDKDECGDYRLKKKYLSRI